MKPEEASSRERRKVSAEKPGARKETHAAGDTSHIIPTADGGPDTEDNAAPLCPSCHDIYGANPVKRKLIREVRNFWYELCARSAAFPVATNDDIARLSIQN